MAVPVRGQIRVGIIGAGLIGQTHSMMLRYVADSTEQSVRVVSIADVSHPAAERLAARWQGARALESAEEIIADPSIDAVWICTPTAMHRQVCIAAARAGKHIFCEKPLAMTAAEAAEMAAAIKASGVISQVGLVLRFSPVYNVIKAMFEEADVGQIAQRHDARRPGLPDPRRARERMAQRSVADRGRHADRAQRSRLRSADVDVRPRHQPLLPHAQS